MAERDAVVVSAADEVAPDLDPLRAPTDVEPAVASLSRAFAFGQDSIALDLQVLAVEEDGRFSSKGAFGWERNRERQHAHFVKRKDDESSAEHRDGIAVPREMCRKVSTM